jgi:hypothetical protein
MTIDKTTKTAKPTKIARQPMMGISHWMGKVEETMPKDPVMSIQELARNCAPGAIHRL